MDISARQSEIRAETVVSSGGKDRKSKAKQFTEIYHNLCIALRISATLPVTVASAETSFSKLKLLKTYLRSTMAQERLSGLAVISINHEVGGQISYNDVIYDFAARKARRNAL